MKRILSAVLTLLLIMALFSGCNVPGNDVSETPSPTPVSEGPEEEAYVAHYTALPPEFADFRAAAAAGDALYVMGYNMMTQTAVLGSVDLESMEYSKIAEMPEGTLIYDFTTVSDTVGWYLAPNIEEGGFELCSISLDSGEELRRIAVEAAGQLLELGDGRLGYTVSSASGSVLCAVEDDGAISELGGMPTADVDMMGMVGADLSAAGMLEGKNLGSDYIALYSFTAGETEKTEILRWLDLDIEPSRVMLLGSHGRDILLMSMRGSAAASLSVDLITLKPTPVSQIPKRTELTLGCITRDNTLTQAVFDFNRRDGQYRIKILDYSDGQPVWGNALNGVINKLNKDILDGNMPDILVADVGLPLKSYVEKGLLADLSGYFADSGIELTDGLEQACTADGKLVYAAPFFVVTTMFGSSDTFGTQLNWTLDEALEAAATLPEGVALLQSGMTRQAFMSIVYTYYLDEFVDWDKGTVHFDSPVFEKLLQLAATIPETGAAGTLADAAGDVLDGRCLLAAGNLMNVDNMVVVNTIYDGKLVCKGFPTVSGSGSAFNLINPLAVSSHSENKDGAWRFISGILQPDYQRMVTDFFPANKLVLEEYLDRAAAVPTPEDGVRLTYYMPNGAGYTMSAPWDGDEGDIMPKGKVVWMSETGETLRELEYYELSDADRAAFMEFLGSIDRVVTYDRTIAGIIEEESPAYFAGDRSLEDIIQIIQSRTAPYVAEQK